MSGYFVTGTDTGVGKTRVAAALVVALRRAGHDAVPMKPVQTGCRRCRGQWVAPDLEYCLRASGLRPAPGEQEKLAPYRFGPACSPHLAARLAGCRISPARIVKAFRDLEAVHGYVVAEGAGGVLVPIDRKRTMLDLMAALALPVVLVARPGLGTINHTLLSLRALEAAGLQVAAVVINQAYPGRPGRIERDNQAVIAAMGKAPVAASFPHGATVSEMARQLALLVRTP